MSKYIGIDMGLSKVGIAVSDADGICAFPRGYIAFTGFENLVKEIAELVQKEDVDIIVIGRPLNMDGSQSALCDMVSVLAALLVDETNARVVLFDERRTTLYALESLRQTGIKAKKSKDKKDAVAASILLSSYLEKIRNKAGTPPE